MATTTNSIMLRDGSGAGAPRRGPRTRARCGAQRLRSAKYFRCSPKDGERGRRLTERAWRLWSEMMQQEDVCDAGDRRAAGAADRRLRDLLPDAGIAVRVRTATRRSARPPTSRRRQAGDVARANAPSRRSQAGHGRADQGKGRRRRRMRRDVATDLLATQDAPKTEAPTPAPEQDLDVARNVRRPSR